MALKKNSSANAKCSASPKKEDAPTHDLLANKRTRTAIDFSASKHESLMIPCGARAQFSLICF